ncbi:MAG: class I adenylate-forming enzyme family protein [Proteobacteria bacterium]|nr:class I adenylate-forming enzyme family protein [Pseudomonadota bacterium]
MNISLLLQMAAEACPDRRALTHLGHDYTYSELYDAARHAAKIFADSGCRYVSLLDTSSPAVPIALMGAAMAGLPYVPINYRLSEAQVRDLIARVEPVYLIISDEFGHRYHLKGHLEERHEFLGKVLRQHPIEFEAAADPSAVAVQLFTSGTTGAPKAALLRNEHLVSYILGSVDFMGAEHTEATLVSVPPYHIAGISAVMSAIYSCRRLVQLPDFKPSTWLELCLEEHVTNAFVVPTMLTRIIDEMEASQFDPADLHRLVSVAYGGGKMPVPVIRKALQLLPHVNFTNAYGLTETSSTITLLDPDDHRSAHDTADDAVRARLASVGRPLPTVEVEIRDEDGRVLGPGERGEIYVRGPQVSGEYEGRSVLDSEGWFPTRDAGYLDDAGYLFLSGRADDVIVRGGENISPGEIEDLLHHHPAILDAAAVGMPSDVLPLAVALAVVLRQGQEITGGELEDHIRIHLRSSRVPESIRFVEELPYNETGKLLRRVVREWFAD